MSWRRVQTASHPTGRFYEGNRSVLDILQRKMAQIFSKRGVRGARAILGVKSVCISCATRLQSSLDSISRNLLKGAGPSVLCAIVYQRPTERMLLLFIRLVRKCQDAFMNSEIAAKASTMAIIPLTERPRYRAGTPQERQNLTTSQACVALRRMLPILLEGREERERA